MYTDKVPTLRELTNDDVLLGRGFPAIENEGNVRFRELVRSRSAEYHAAYRRHTKDSIARDVVNTIHRRNGRFLTQLDDVANIKGLIVPAGARVWTEADDVAVLVKAKQALRDHSDDSKESSRTNTRRRPAEGSGNLVLEWVVPSSSSEQVEVPGANFSSATAAWAMPGPPNVAGSSSSTQQVSNLSSFLASSSQHLSFLNEEGGGSRRIPVSTEATAAALLTAVARQQQQQQQSMLLPGGQFNSQAFLPASNIQMTLQHVLENRQGQGTFAGVDSNIPVGLAGLLQSTADPSLASLQSMYATHPTMTAISSDRGLNSSQGVLSSTSSNSLTSSQPTLGGKVGSRASIAISRAMGNASVAGRMQEEGDLLLCDLELNLLSVLCSFGLPLWTKGSNESAFAPPGTTREKGSLEFGWFDLSKHLLAACQSTASAVTAATKLSTDLPTLAKIAIFLVGRCANSAKVVETPAVAAAASSSIRSGGTVASLTQQGDGDVVQHVLTRWSLELGDCCALDGSHLGGTMIEVLHFMTAEPNVPAGGGEEEKRASPRSGVTVAAVLSSGDSRTTVETISTLSQLRWIFQHPTATIYSLLSSQAGDTSRDYLLLKGVLEHGLANELDFRIEGSSMTRSEIEDRISLLTKLLFKNLQELQKKEAFRSLKRTFTALMGAG
mmetsp:Transcript_5889/g.12067  ORF Transcript_5889/g.12067 Transcript_5889/m.12067 type:complete len:668 (+) Transcript_5889:256-2259(+)